MEIVEIEETASTNSWLAAVAADAPHGLAVTARRQTAGRGQRGNSWESAPGMNITMSVLLRPEGIHPSRQFIVSQAVAVAIAGVLARHLPGEDVCVKWPNDIYIGDRKICGILIENSITSTAIKHSIVGVGININQRVFVSDAPNPVSMFMLTGREFPLRELTEEFVGAILREVDAVTAPSASDMTAAESRDEAATASPCENASIGSLRERYAGMMWRHEGYWPYRDLLRGELIRARIAGVAPDGILTLAVDSANEATPGSDSAPTPAEELRSYAFKEVAAVL